MLDIVSDTRVVFLDELTPLQAHVGYGQLGTRGSLGYEGKRVVVQNRSHAHALSAHPPARVLYHLNGRYTTFSADVAINDDAGRTTTHADFTVLVDGVRASEVRHLRAGEAPRRLSADVRGAQCLELVVATSHWNHCHAVWLEPRLEMTLEIPRPSSIQDCLGRAEIALPAVTPRATRCIATLVSAGYEELADDMLGSLFGNGDCQDALLVMFVLGRSAETLQLAAKYGALVVPCQARAAVNPMSKAVLYSIARVVDADYYLCLDSDMLVLGSIRPVFAALEACPDSTILAVREANGTTFLTVGDAFLQVYGGNQGELSRFASDAEAAYPLVVNDGIFAGSKAAMCALDETIRGLAWAAEWMDERRDIWWRNQFVFNLALAKLHCGVELDGRTTCSCTRRMCRSGAAPCGVAAQWRGRPVRVLHLQRRGQAQVPGMARRLCQRTRSARGTRGAGPLSGFRHRAPRLDRPLRHARAGLVVLWHRRRQERPRRRRGWLPAVRCVALSAAVQRLCSRAGDRHGAGGFRRLHRLGDRVARRRAPGDLRSVPPGRGVGPLGGIAPDNAWCHRTARGRFDRRNAPRARTGRALRRGAARTRCTAPSMSGRSSSWRPGWSRPAD